MVNLESGEVRDGKLGDGVMRVAKNEVVKNVEFSKGMAEVMEMQISRKGGKERYFTTF